MRYRAGRPTVLMMGLLVCASQRSTTAAETSRSTLRTKSAPLVTRTDITRPVSIKLYPPSVEIRGSNSNRFGSRGSIVALTQWVWRAPNVSTRVKLPSTPPLGRLIGLSTLK